MPKFEEAPVMLADPTSVHKAMRLLTCAHRPLVIVGKGKAHSQIRGGIKKFLKSARSKSSQTLRFDI